MQFVVTTADVIPRGSSPSPGPVTSRFYRIGRPRPGPVYTSQQTAAGVSFPSCWTGNGRDGERSGRYGMSIRLPVNSLPAPAWSCSLTG